LKHIVSAEAGYLRLVTGKRIEEPADWELRPSLRDLMAFAIMIGEALIEAAENVPLDYPLREEWEGQELRYDALLVFLQLIQHGIEHRTNITTMLAIEHLDPPSVDGWSYLLSNRERFDRDSA
jgi:uncharacterized damage-inducible protein DinB